ncbi:MAG: hypothetical protein ACHQFX_06615 [Chitinophagales bacterium]
MEFNSWQKSVITAIISKPSFGIKTVTDLEDLGTWAYNEDNFSKICSQLEKGKFTNVTDLEENPFEDITVIRFKDDKSNNYFGIVYDSWALEQDPEIMRIYPFVPTPT